VPRTIRSSPVRTLSVANARELLSVVPVADEPCLGCGEETAVGSVFFSDRHTIEHTDGQRTYLCTLCDSPIRSSRKGRRLTDKEVRNIVENGSIVALGWRP
jgi:hypothetical protein